MHNGSYSWELYVRAQGETGLRLARLNPWPAPTLKLSYDTLLVFVCAEPLPMHRASIESNVGSSAVYGYGFEVQF